MPHPLAPLLPPVTRFLLEEVCMPAASAEGADNRAFTATQLAAEAYRQGVVGLLHQWAQVHADSELSGDLLKLLARQLQANAVHALRLVNDTVRLVELLRQAGVDSLVIKGPLLSKRYYGDYGVRDAGDVDILVSEETIVKADRALHDGGYQRTKPQQVLVGRRLRLYIETQHEFGYRSATSSDLVELHWRFADCALLSPQSFLQLWAKSEVIPVGRSALRVLCPADTFMQLATHGATDGWSRLKWIADLPRVHSELTRADLEDLRLTSARNSTHRLLQIALAMSSSTGSAPAASPSWLDRTLRHARDRLITASPGIASTGARLRAFANGYRYLISLVDGSEARRAITYANLITPKDFDLLPLPDALTPLLPYLAQCRRGVQRLLSRS